MPASHQLSPVKDSPQGRVIPSHSPVVLGCPGSGRWEWGRVRSGGRDMEEVWHKGTRWQVESEGSWLEPM